MTPRVKCLKGAISIGSTRQRRRQTSQQHSGTDVERCSTHPPTDQPEPRSTLLDV